MKTLRTRAGQILLALALPGLACLSLARAEPVDAPYPADIFIRGGFNGWSVADPMRFDRQSNTYSGLVSLSPGSWEFKIASQDWATVDLGNAVDPAVDLSVPKTLTFSPGGGNLSLAVPTGGVYSFTLDAADTASPQLTVAYARRAGDAHGAEIWYGTFNLDWYFPCLGQDVLATIDVKAQLNNNPNPAGGYLYTENLQTDGSAVDSSGGNYAVRDARINTYVVQPGGGEIYQSQSRLRMRSLDGGTDLLVTMIIRVQVAADGSIVRFVDFQDFSCRN